MQSPSRSRINLIVGSVVLVAVIVVGLLFLKSALDGREKLPQPTTVQKGANPLRPEVLSKIWGTIDKQSGDRDEVLDSGLTQNEVWAYYWDGYTGTTFKWERATGKITATYMKGPGGGVKTNGDNTFPPSDFDPGAPARIVASIRKQIGGSAELNTFSFGPSSPSDQTMWRGIYKVSSSKYGTASAEPDGSNVKLNPPELDATVLPPPNETM